MSTRQRAQRGETTEFSGRVRHWERVQRFQKTNPLNSEGVIDYGWVADDNGGYLYLLRRIGRLPHPTILNHVQPGDKVRYIR